MADRFLPMAPDVGRLGCQLGWQALGGSATKRNRMTAGNQWVGVVALLFSDQLAESVDDLLPGAVPAPAHVVAVHDAPVGVAVGQRPPLAAGGGHVQDGVHDGSPVVEVGPADLSFAREGWDQIGYEFPLGVGQIAMSAMPGCSICFAAVLDDCMISRSEARTRRNRPLTATIFRTAS